MILTYPSHRTNNVLLISPMRVCHLGIRPRYLFFTNFIDNLFGISSHLLLTLQQMI